MSRFVLRLIASLLCAGLIASAAPAAAQDGEVPPEAGELVRLQELWLAATS